MKMDQIEADVIVKLAIANSFSLDLILLKLL